MRRFGAKMHYYISLALPNGLKGRGKAKTGPRKRRGREPEMGAWIKVVTHLLGFAAVCLLGCVLLAYLQASAPAAPQAAKPAVQPAAVDCSPVSKSSAGAGSPNVNCVNGSVTINVDQSSGTKASPQAAARRASADQPASVKRWKAQERGVRC